MLETNQVEIIGTIEEECKFDHEIYGEKFYRTRTIVERLSGVKDYVPVIISERVIEINKLQPGVQVKIAGQFRSHNENDRRLLVFVFVDMIEILSYSVAPKNVIFLDGYVCRKPTFREKVASDRKISYILLAVNRRYGKSDYIPCIAWGRNAISSKNCAVGDRIKISGRIQSREYLKLDEIKEVYEVSINSIEF